MRVLMVLDANDGRGMFRHGYILAKELAQKGNDVTIAYIDPEDGISLEDGVPVHRISGITQKMGFLYAQQNVRHHPPMPDRLVIKKLFKIVEEFRPDVIHVHGWVLYSVACLKKHTNIPIAATLHDYGFFCPTKTLLNNNRICESNSIIECLKCGKKHYGYSKDVLTVYGVNRYEKMLKSSVDLYIAVSTYVKERYVKAGFQNNTIEAIPNFYNTEEIEKYKVSTSDRLPDDFVLYVGEFTQFKGVEILLTAYKNINAKTKLVLIGKPYYAGLQGKNVIVLENPPRNVVVEAFKKCKFVVIPSIWADPCPTVAFEAMACNKAIVASKAGGLTDIVIEKGTGFLVPPGCPDSLSSAISTLLNNIGLAQKMGALGYSSLLKNFSLSAVVPYIADSYKSITS